MAAEGQEVAQFRKKGDAMINGYRGLAQRRMVSSHGKAWHPKFRYGRWFDNPHKIKLALDRAYGCKQIEPLHKTERLRRKRFDEVFDL